MKKQLAKLKYLPNNFEVIEAGDYVICAISNKGNKIREFKLLGCRSAGTLLFI